MADERGGAPLELLRDVPHCVRCGFPVPDRPHGCRWPCENCGHLYPLGDCSD